MVPRGGLGTINAWAPFDDVEVDFNNPMLAPGQLDPCREPGFERLSRPVASRPQEKVFRGLHRDRAGADQLTAFASVALPCRLDRVPIEPVMLAEPGILAGDYG